MLSIALLYFRGGIAKGKVGALEDTKKNRHFQMNADFFVLQPIIGVPDTTCKGCGGESGDNCALYCAVRNPLA